MKKTMDRNVTKDSITVDAEHLAALLGCGRQTAVKIGADAGAKITIGRRVLYKVDRINQYLDGLAE